jgi:hypothetical protein
VLDTLAKGRRVDRREAIEHRLDLLEVAAEPPDVDAAGADEGADVVSVTSVAPLQLGEGLRVGVEVVEAELSSLLGKQTALLPAGRQRDEIAGRGKLDVHLQLLLEAGDCAQDGVLLGDQLQVDVDGRPSPAEEDGRGTTGQVAASRVLGRGVERRQKASDPFGIG